MKTNKDLIIEPNAAIEGRKYSEEKPWSCKYCYWWGGKKKGCSLKQCHYLLPEKKKAVKTTGSRTRLNIMGALNLKALTSPLICEYKTINEYNVSRFFNEIRKVYPDYNQKIHVILDGAGYHRSQLVKDWAEVVNIRLHYLPPYSPNLNPIERMWKLMNEHARNNRYFSSTREFRDAISVFFNQTLPDIADSLTSRINDHFQVLTPAS